jgi:GH15 family glucan-1,4-alpha-glucosidase
MYDYGVIGNCHINALVSNKGSIDWLCLPQPDSPPVFGKLLDPHGGDFTIESSDGVEGVQSYVTNTNILETIFTQKNGAKFKITDFCPRFEQYGRMYRPPMIIRIVTPLSESSLIKVNCNGVDGWGKKPLGILHGNSHVRFTGFQNQDQLRLTTNMPLTYLNSGQPFVLHEPLYFALTWGAPFESDLKSTCETFLMSTEKYWTTWVKHCQIPTQYQDEVIRSALVLKLHCFEDTGAILASLTSSLPEEVGNVRNWDYRFCWLRDAYFSLTAFHSLGQFEEMEGFLRFLLNIAHQSNEDDGLHPVYKLDSGLPLPEISHEAWKGWHGSTPVRSGNEAATHVQNDVYGEMILSLAPIFFDERFVHLRNVTSRATGHSMY